MSAPNTVIAWGTRYTINGTVWTATGGDINYKNDLANVTDSERLGARKRKAGPYEAEVTVRGNLATDVSPFVSPQSIAVGYDIPTVSIFTYGAGFPPDIFVNCTVESFHKVLGDPDQGTPNTWELKFYTGTFSAN
jgi:hypothetical protein